MNRAREAIDGTWVRLKRPRSADPGLLKAHRLRHERYAVETHGQPHQLPGLVPAVAGTGQRQVQRQVQPAGSASAFDPLASSCRMPEIHSAGACRGVVCRAWPRRRSSAGCKDRM